jgi:hypothetical protein
MSAALERCLAFLDEALGYEPRPVEADEGPDDEETS